MMIAPPMAVIAGIVFRRLWILFTEKDQFWWIFPVSILTTGLFHAFLIMNFGSIFEIFGMILIYLSGVVFISLIIVRQFAKVITVGTKLVIITVSLIIITIAPLTSSVVPIVCGGDVNLPHTGPDLIQLSDKESGDVSEYHRYKPHIFDIEEIQALINYLNHNHRHEKYLIGVPSSIEMGSKLTIATEKPVLTMGGFNGRDNPLKLEDLKEKVAKGEIRYFLIPKPPELNPDINFPSGQNLPTNPPEGMGNPFQNLIPLFEWIHFNGYVIDESEWSGGNESLLRYELYDCRFKNN